MTIEIEDYKLEQCSSCPDRFDLYWTRKTDPNHPFSKSENGEKQVVVGYGMGLARCIEKIIYNNLNNQKIVVSLEDFLKIWKSEVKRIENLLIAVMSR